MDREGRDNCNKGQGCDFKLSDGLTEMVIVEEEIDHDREQNRQISQSGGITGMFQGSKVGRGTGH